MPRPLIKVCGMTRMEDVNLCMELGVDLLGFIFHPSSPRNVDLDFAASIKTGKLTKVGVFVKQSASEVMEIMDQCGLHAAQLHGGQDLAFCETIGPDRVIKVLWPGTYASESSFLRDIEDYSEVCGHFLFDAGKTGHGGTGQSIDFDIMQHIDIQTPWFLAGGIGPQNIDAAMATNPPGLDINSGVEKTPGIKDETKLREIFDHLARVP
jgi:phosphoribosylanthranilate isomerase